MVKGIKHSKPDRCPYCNSARYHIEKGFTKPVFVCDNKCKQWSFGREGGEYLKNARNFVQGMTWKDWVKEIIE